MQILKSKKNCNYVILKIPLFCPLRGMGLQWGRVSEEYCWAKTQAAERSCWSRTNSGVLAFGFHLYSLLCISILCSHAHWIRSFAGLPTASQLFKAVTVSTAATRGSSFPRCLLESLRISCDITAASRPIFIRLIC